jgi:hypothetical protein
LVVVDAKLFDESRSAAEMRTLGETAKMDWKRLSIVGSGATGGMAAKCLTGGERLFLEAGPELSPDLQRETGKSQEEFAFLKARQPIQSRSLEKFQTAAHISIW